VSTVQDRARAGLQPTTVPLRTGKRAKGRARRMRPPIRGGMGGCILETRMRRCALTWHSVGVKPP
jgi:hypothetical protein